MSVYPGNILTATAATVNANPTSTRTWQWLRNGTAIPDATASGYVVTTDDLNALLTAQQTETNFLGATSATSADVGPVETYSPAMLFALNEPGVWFDPSDLTTLFQGTANLTPVTAPGDAVSLMLDKSKGLVLGPELVVNPDFSTDTWWLKGAGCTISGGVGVATAAVTGSGFYRTAFLTVGKYYEITFTVVSVSAGGFRVGFFASAYSAARTVPGTYTVRLLADGTSFVVETVGTTTGTIDNVSVKEVTGNHAVQATFANRPLYGIVPFGGRRNLLLQTEAFNESVWLKENLLTVSPNTALAPDGTMTAETLTSAVATTTTRVNQVLSPLPSGVATASYYVKANGARFLQASWTTSATSQFANFDLQTEAVTAGTYTSATITPASNGYYRITLTSTLASVNGAPFLAMIDSGSAARGSSFTGNGTSGIFIWGAQLETGSTATAYQRVTTQYDVTEAGVQSCSYLFFDGADGMGTTVDTNTIFGVAGSDPGYMIVGGVNYNTAGGSASPWVRSAFLGDTGGYFGMWAYTVNGGEAGIFQWDTSEKTAARAYTIGSSAVFTGKRNPLEGVAGKIYASVNGISSAGTDAAALNSVSGTLQVGRQFAGLLNGQLFGIVARGAASTPAQISSTEYWMGNKTGINIANNISPTIFARDDTAVLDRFNQIIERRA